jgi:hypothetical protein
LSARGGIGADGERDYADFEKDLLQDLMPTIESHYSVKAKIEAVAALQVKISMLRCSKGIKPVVKDINDEQKKRLDDMGAQGYNQLFVGGRGMGGFGGMGMPGRGRGAAPIGN